MKNPICAIIVLFLGLSCYAQTINIHMKNGTTIEFKSDNVDYVDFTEKASDPTISNGEYVDLGLSVKWATCNLGATTPTEYGKYYAWGETSPNGTYSKEKYAYYNASTSTYTNIGDDISRTAFDAATANLGDDWRMPTKTEWNELINKCKWEWTQINGINGYKITGSNGNSIFIPAAGGYTISSGMITSRGSECDLWSSTLYSDGFAYDAELNSSSTKNLVVYKFRGLSIRPVYDPISANGIENITDYIKIERTGSSSMTFNGEGKFSVTFQITNSSTEQVHLSTLAGVDISTDLAGGKSYSVTLQSTSKTLQTEQQKLVFTYNGKTYSIEG